MFPNAQDALPLPRRPNVERYRKLAKELVKACRLNEPDAIAGWSTKCGAGLPGKWSWRSSSLSCRARRALDAYNRGRRRQTFGEKPLRQREKRKTD
jgi:hypothetical protein